MPGPDAARRRTGSVALRQPAAVAAGGARRGGCSASRSCSRRSRHRTAPQNMDMWDGYPAARARVLDFLAREQISNLAILTGDIHSSWAMDVPRNPFRGYTPAPGPDRWPWSWSRRQSARRRSSPVPVCASQRAAAAGGAAPEVLDGESRGYVLLDIDPNASRPTGTSCPRWKGAGTRRRMPPASCASEAHRG